MAMYNNTATYVFNQYGHCIKYSVNTV